MTSEKDYGAARTAYWHGFDFTGTARLANGLTVQGGTSTGRAVRDICNVTRALPELLATARVDSCDVTENWTTVFRGLASYTLPKIDVLVSTSIRSLERHTWRRRGHQWSLAGGQLRGAEHRDPGLAWPPAS